MTRAADDSVTARRLRAASRAPGCPVCACVEEESRRDLAAVLAEHVTDVDTRRRLRASEGFCAWHAHLLGQVPDSAFGTAILCEDLLGRLIRRLSGLAEARNPSRVGAWLLPGRDRSARRLTARRGRRPPCPACERAADAEGRYLRCVLTVVETAEGRVTWARGDGLCAPHLLRTIEIAPRHRALPALAAVTLGRWATVRQELGSFLARHQGDGPGQFSEGERAARGRALGILAGTAGLFGSELPRARRR